jgi:hypothetical protein
MSAPHHGPARRAVLMLPRKRVMDFITSTGSGLAGWLL